MNHFHVLTRDGVRIAFHDVGDGPGVLLIHGWSLSGEVWDRQIRVLAESGHRVVAMDLRGHGNSDAPRAGYHIDSLCDDAIEVIDQRALDRVALVGWSLGGLVAMRLACRRPDLARSLVLVASNGVASARHETFPFGVPPEGPLEAMLAAEHADRISFRRKAVGDPFKGSDPEPSVLDWLHRISLQTPSWAAGAALRTLMTTEQVDLLNRLSLPVTQIVGDADPALSVRGARWVRDRLGGELVELDAGHYPMLECPDDFDEALLAGLRTGAGLRS